ncbi:hypothetical protein FACS189454_02620 [Planctomycetales bacterium]|nr:hypothetical protein FACS189454_02620 [Planctomycetales bacterium]
MRIDGGIPDDVPAIIETMDSVGDFIEENYLEEAAEEILKQVNSNAKVER